ncbi:TetR/AcrR family transcriptional regulator [Cryptosporangium sp. NPDC048952]|uniref:TetR/AcrR family transcriptional regulator n=1 Tax=Cryptosporangium sp. NPDC048952 TaxID=3363961 RepID=UPI0037135C23
MAGLRERKKEQTRARIAAVALELFAERGYDAVTVNEIAAAAEVAKATLFSYFPSKEALVLGGVADDDLAGVVTGRPADESVLQALRAHFQAMATSVDPDFDPAALVTRMRVMFDSPALSAAANGLLYQQRQALTAALAAEFAPTVATLAAAQISATVLALQESFFGRLVAGASLAEAGSSLATDVDIAFDLLEHGLSTEGL